MNFARTTAPICLKQVTFASLLVILLFSNALAQQVNNAPAQSSSLTITAGAESGRVRITAPPSIVQLHVEIYAASGEKIFDQEIRGGNVCDWLLQNGQGERVTPGSYISLVTAKSVSGRLTQKIGSVNVEEKSANVQAATFQQLTTMQAQAIGPVEENSSWLVAGTEEPLTPTVIAHDGNDGQMIRGRGALSFRIGNFFTGNDREQMRLTEDGRLGLGTSDPRATLDVAGTIRAQRILIAKPARDGISATDTLQLDRDEFQPLIAGTGTPNQIAKWIDNAGTLGNSTITETANGFVGIGTSNPTQRLHLFSPGASDNILQTFQNGTRNWSIGVNGVGDFFRISDNTAGVARLTISNYGNVGIGTTNPSFKLHVDGGIGNVGVYGRSGAAYGIFGSSDTSAGVTGSSVSGIGVYGDSVSGLAGYFSNTVGIMGNLGVGTYTPSWRLHLSGPETRMRMQSSLSTAYTEIKFHTDGRVWNTGVGGSATQVGGKYYIYDETAGQFRLMIDTIGRVTIPGSISSTSGTFLAPGTGAAVWAESGGSTPTIQAISYGGYGVRAEATSGGKGVWTTSDTSVALFAQSGSGTALQATSSSGDLVEGFSGATRKFHITNAGTYVTGSDFAEAIPVTGDRATYEPGDVLVVSSSTPGKVERASRAYDSRVAGIYSTRPGMLGAEKGGTSRVDPDDVPVAIVGIVPTKVSAMNGAIRVGDLLTTSNLPGHAMRCANRVKCVGAIVGKALEPLAKDKGVIRVLVMLR